MKAIEDTTILLEAMANHGDKVNEPGAKSQIEVQNGTETATITVETSWDGQAVNIKSDEW